MLNHSALLDWAIDISRGCYYRRKTGDFRVTPYGHHSLCYRDAGIRSGIYFLLGEFFIGGEPELLVKIGMTKDIKNRRVSMMGDNPTELYLVHFLPVGVPKKGELAEAEAEQHTRFRKYRFDLPRRREWFEAKPICLELGLPWEKFVE